MRYDPWKCALAILGGAILGGLGGAEVGGAYPNYVIIFAAIGVIGGICAGAATAC
jgi:hypothetical protein